MSVFLNGVKQVQSAGEAGEHTHDLEEYHNVLTYTDGNLTKVETYADNTLAAKLFTKDFTYSSGSLTQIVITDEATSGTETKSFTYDGSGNLTAITLS